jgi:acyl carrier protein
MMTLTPRLPHAGPQLEGILLAGGVLRDATLAKQTAGSVRAVFAPKVAGVQAALRAAYGAPLAAVKLFSSIAASLGSGGQANYAAANAVLDATAARLQRQGLAAVSVGWGAWAGSGMAEKAGIARMERLGFGALQPAAGMAALGSALAGLCRSAAAQTPPRLLASVILWDRLGVAAGFYGEFKQAVLPAQPSERAESAAAQGSTRAAGLSPVAIAGLIRGAVSSVLGADVSAEQPLVEAGLDSLGAVELRNEIGKAVGLELPGTLVFDYPSVAAITGMLAAKLARKQESPPAREVPAALHSAAVSSSKLIAVQDMSSRLPAASNSPASHDAISATPLDRWDVDAIPESNLGGRFGGFVDAWAQFDAAAFGITPSEAALMDPQQRALLEVCIRCSCLSSISRSA